MADKRSRLTRARKAAGYTQEKLAAALHVDRNTVARWESGKSEPLPYNRPKLGKLLRLSCQQLEALLSGESPSPLANGAGDAFAPTRTPDTASVLTTAETPPDVPLDSSYVESLHHRIRELIALDIQFGGDQSAPLATRLFQSVHRKLGRAACNPSVERDLYAAAGELGELTGWLLYDAGQHDAVRRMNQEALSLSRLAGDHNMELLTLQNMSMHAGALGRSTEALRIAQAVLTQNELSPRVKALFLTREARALVCGGDESGAQRSFAQARSLYLEGTRDDDPSWAWWIADHELAWHEGMIYGNSETWDSALEAFQQSVELMPPNAIRGRYVHLTSLFNAQVRAKAWSEIEETIARLIPYVDEVGSTRTATTLLTALPLLERSALAPAATRDAGMELRRVLEEAGYETKTLQ